MAKFNYTKEEIIALKPEGGELALLNFLEQLDDSYEVYFQLNLNIDNPDIVVMRKDYGVLVIEVKNFASINSFICNEKYHKESPAGQVKRYKDNLYDLHINGIAEKKVKDKYYYGIVRCALYLHGYTKKEAKMKLLQYDNEYEKKPSYYTIIGKDSLEDINEFQKIISTRKSLFTNELYEEFKHVFRPSIIEKEQLNKPSYNNTQKKLIDKLDPKQQKIKGPAGSGKTLILAQRAVNAHKRTGGNILVLTFNITLKNYIIDKISVVKENLSRKDFAGVLNYHTFFSIEANNYGLKIYGLEDFENEDFFESVKDKIKKYDAIFIDEIQDYETEWIKIIKKYFLIDNGEFVIFGDGKQNIYKRLDLDNLDMDSGEYPSSTILGRWNEQLKTNYRSFGKINNLDIEFQNSFFSGREQELGLQEHPQKDREMFVKYYDSKSSNLENIASFVSKFCRKHNIQEKELCVISSKIATVREIDYFYRKNNKGKNTRTTFEELETYNYLKNAELKDEKLKKVRRSKKYNFHMNPGCLKLSTIHSFKGWEAPYIFLILNKDEKNDQEIKNEDSNMRIYTAITRARYGLYVINMGNKDYDKFFANFCK